MFSDLYIRSIKLKNKQQTDPEDYVFSLPVIRNLTSLNSNKKVTFFVGENGSGKSTLLSPKVFQDLKMASFYVQKAFIISQLK